MKHKTNGLVSLLSCIAIGCAAPSTMLKGRIDVKYSDENYHYCYLLIKNTTYHIMGTGRDKFIAEFDAQRKLDFIIEVMKPTVADLEEADNPLNLYNIPHLMRYIIEPQEFEELKFIIIYRNIRESASK